MSDQSQITKYEPQTPPAGGAMSIFSNEQNFAHGQRIGKALASSDLVPEAYQGNLSNTLVALEMSNRIGASPLMVMQNLNVIHGRPSWSSSFIIAALNSCGRFEPLRFRISGAGDSMECIAWTRDREGHELEGPAVSIQMAKDEGWYGRKGSKWKTMPELMLRYRAAAFFGRLYAPEILMGMKATDEIEDIGYEIINESESSSRVNDPSITINKLNAGIEKAAAAPAPAAEQDGEQKEEKMPEKETDPIADNDEELL